MRVRRLITGVLAGLGTIVLASLGYGSYLLLRSDHTAWQRAQARAGREAWAAEQIRQAHEDRRAGKVEQAILIYRRILAEGPSLSAQVGLAEAELEAGREEAAAGELERVLRLDSKHPAALLPLARLYLARSSGWERAEPLLRTHLAVRPDDAEAQHALARVLAWQGRSKEALTLYTRDTVKTRLEDGDQRDYAFALAGAGRTAEAEPLLRKLRESRPNDAGVARQLAGIHASRREWSDALPLYTEAVRGSADDPQLDLEYGYALVALGRTKEALAPLQRAARGRPSSGEAGLAHARVLRATGDGKSAAREFERIRPLYARDSGVLREYGDLLLERRDHGAAIDHYRAAMALGLRDHRLLTALAGALQADGRWKDSVPLLEEAYALERTDKVAFDLAKLYQRMGRNAEALRLLNDIEARKRASR